MSKTIISIERVNEVRPHPNAIRLDVIQVLGYQVVTQKNSFKIGDVAVYFPPDILLPSAQAEALGVANYLKHAIFPGDETKTQCRVGAARLRGSVSHGFCIPAPDPNVPFGTDVTAHYDAAKYEPPVRLGSGDTERELENFPRYTSIENIQRYPDAIPDGTNVVLTEKIHGTNCRMGLVRVDGEYQFVAGSHNQRRSAGGDGPTFYWQFMDEKTMNLLTDLCNTHCCDDEPCHDAVIYGEIFGPGVQDMDYGLTGKRLRIFDIAVDGVYLDYWDMVGRCDKSGLIVVPQLAIGSYSAEFVEQHTYGPTIFNGVKAKFKGREGCVVRPLREQFSDVLGGRMILKSVSADYRDRKGATDDE